MYLGNVNTYTQASHTHTHSNTCTTWYNGIKALLFMLACTTIRAVYKTNIWTLTQTHAYTNVLVYYI